MRSSSSIVLGVLCILIGIGLTADRFFAFEFGWMQIYPLLLLALAATSAVKLSPGHRPSAFNIGFFGALGAFFFLRNYGLIDQLWLTQSWPVIILAVGIGFAVSFIYNPRDWGFLVPAVIFLGLGTLFILDSVALIRGLWDILWEGNDRFWPIVLIVIGGLMILRSAKGRSGHEHQ
ncbi:MAG: hypothetical protein ONA69_00660 [candidate division KSB1 bacterium]|nr:hypothetical protein [candidate division KSB1 bacterium]